LYGIAGLIFLAPFVLVLAAWRGIIESPGTYLMIFLAKASPLIVSGLLCYSFLALKKWGRYLALFSNCVCALFFLLAALDEFTMTTYREANWQSSLGLSAIFIALIGFALLRPVRDVMQ
jgi:hypothetical protein